ncbi:unnamed protein product, partial [Prorocentrum cordatum]
MKKTLPSGKTRLQMLKCAAQPERLEWMLNAARMRSRMTREERALLPAGTTSNESFHMELKRCFFGQAMHSCMLSLKLAVIQIAKLMTHNPALYHQTLAQVPQSRLLHRLAGATELFGQASWERWCAPLCADGAAQKAPSPYAAEGKTLQARASQWRAAKGDAGNRRDR